MSEEYPIQKGVPIPRHKKKREPAKVYPRPRILEPMSKMEVSDSIFLARGWEKKDYEEVSEYCVLAKHYLGIKVIKRRMFPDPVTKENGFRIWRVE